MTTPRHWSTAAASMVVSAGALVAGVVLGLSGPATSPVAPPLTTTAQTVLTPPPPAPAPAPAHRGHH